MSHGYWMWPKSTVIDVRETWDLMLFRGTDLNEERTVLLSRGIWLLKKILKIAFSSGDFSSELRLRINARSLRWA